MPALSYCVVQFGFSQAGPALATCSPEMFEQAPSNRADDTTKSERRGQEWAAVRTDMSRHIQAMDERDTSVDLSP